MDRRLHDTESIERDEDDDCDDDDDRLKYNSTLGINAIIVINAQQNQTKSSPIQNTIYLLIKYIV